MKTLIKINSVSRGLIILGLLIGSGCLNSQTSPSLNETTAEALNSTSSFEKILIDEAVIEDIAAHKAECPSNSAKKQQICIQVCHVPPGNPAAAHSKVLPLQAIKAHLGHGDYLGLCESDDNSGGEEEVPPEEEEPVEEEPGTEEPSPEPTPSPTPSPSPSPSPSPTPTPTPEIPLWCQPFISLDADCDGYIDEDGMPYL